MVRWCRWLAAKHMGVLMTDNVVLAEVEARNDPKEQILRDNMRINGYDKIIVNTNSWKFTGPLSSTDVVLEWP